ncbi:MAG: lysozyme inhibitor LprI family protein [Gemmatimonadaceae bacterium]
MTTFRPLNLAALSAVIAFAAACDGGSRAKTSDEFAADSALAADLALANRDTLLVDSIGAYREPDAAERGVPDEMSGPPGTSPAPDQAPVTAAPVASQPEPETPAAAPPPSASPAPRATAPERRITGLRACNSPTLENQSECLRVSLAAADSRLNRIYRALITEMRRQESIAPGARDPASVQRLRVGQRSWLVYRDDECRKRGRGKEGRLWAKPRANCLGDFSVRRAQELADNFSKLTAH